LRFGWQCGALLGDYATQSYALGIILVLILAV
jgi:hypothetical protein